MTIRIFDLSHHNCPTGNPDVDYNYAVVKQNCDGIIYKCSDPELLMSAGHDHTHVAAVEGFRAVGLPFAEYHFHDPSISPVENINYYQRYTRKGFLDALDVEDQETLSLSAFTTHVVNTLKEGAQRTGRKWWLYANYDFLNYRLTDYAGIAANIAGFWLAWPSIGTTFPKPLHYGISAVGIWQKSWNKSCSGIKDTTLDYNEWQWTDEQWSQLVGPPVAKPNWDDLNLDERLELLRKLAVSHGLLEAR